MLNLLVISSLDFFCGVFSLLLVADGEFAIVDGVSAEGRTESGGSCTSGIDNDGGIGVIAARDLWLESLLCNGGIARLDVMLVSSEPSLPLVVDDPV